MKLGIIGGTGWLGGAIARRLLGTGHVAQGDLWLSNRSGKRDGFEAWPDVTITDDSAVLIAACDAVVLAVRPEQLAALGVDAADCLVISVMASTPMARLAELTGASRIIRTMPSPATEHGEGFTPWFPSDNVTQDDRTIVQALFDACGIAEEVASEAQIDWFTGLTGPAPGLFGYAAHALIEASVAHGIDRKVAERAIRFHAMAAGNEIWRGDFSPARDYQRIIDYGGVTTAGFEAATDAGAMEAFSAALDAALQVAKKDRT
jgi:pyrroline-5-carboxylate reductase